jgi:hypothetical protein
MIGAALGTDRSVKMFDSGAMLADLASPEAEPLTDSEIVTANTAEFLFDLYDTFVSMN